MATAKLIVAYPQPKDVEAFEKIYREEHVPMATANLAGKTNRRHQDLEISTGEAGVLSRGRGVFPVNGCVAALRGIGRREGHACQCRENFARWSPGDYDRRRGYV